MRAKQGRALVVSFRGTDPRQIKTLSNLALVPVTPSVGSTIAQARLYSSKRHLCALLIRHRRYCRCASCVPAAAQLGASQLHTGVSILTTVPA
jgi:hypothetical protein